MPVPTFMLQSNGDFEQSAAAPLAFDSEGVSELGQEVNTSGFETRIRRLVQNID